MNGTLNFRFPCRARLFRCSAYLPLLLLSTSPLLDGCKQKPKESASVAPGNPSEVTITAALGQNLKFGTPEISNVTGSLRVAAHVETDAQRIAHVGSPVAGRILQLLVFEGQYVKAGTVLAMLHSTDLSDTQLALVKAVSQQNLAQPLSNVLNNWLKPMLSVVPNSNGAVQNSYRRPPNRPPTVRSFAASA